jgi:hypothetical protein
MYAQASQEMYLNSLQHGGRMNYVVLPLLFAISGYIQKELKGKKRFFLNKNI